MEKVSTCIYTLYIRDLIDYLLVYWVLYMSCCNTCMFHYIINQCDIKKGVLFNILVLEILLYYIQPLSDLEINCMKFSQMM